MEKKVNIEVERQRKGNEERRERERREKGRKKERRSEKGGIRGFNHRIGTAFSTFSPGFLL